MSGFFWTLLGGAALVSLLLFWSHSARLMADGSEAF